MPRRACGTEMKSGPPSFSVCSSLTHMHALFISFLQSDFTLTSCLSIPSHNPLPLSPASSFSGTTVLYRHSYCFTDSVMCIYCSICEIGGTSRQAYYYSITESGRFHSHRAINVSERNITSHQFQKADSLQYCILCIILEKKFSPPWQRELNASNKHAWSLTKRTMQWAQE